MITALALILTGMTWTPNHVDTFEFFDAGYSGVVREPSKPIDPVVLPHPMADLCREVSGGQHWQFGYRSDVKYADTELHLQNRTNPKAVSVRIGMTDAMKRYPTSFFWTPGQRGFAVRDVDAYNARKPDQLQWACNEWVRGSDLFQPFLVDQSEKGITRWLLNWKQAAMFFHLRALKCPDCYTMGRIEGQEWAERAASEVIKLKESRFINAGLVYTHWVERVGAWPGGLIMEDWRYNREGLRAWYLHPRMVEHVRIHIGRGKPQAQADRSVDVVPYWVYQWYGGRVGRIREAYTLLGGLTWVQFLERGGYLPRDGSPSARQYDWSTRTERTFEDIARQQIPYLPRYEDETGLPSLVGTPYDRLSPFQERQALAELADKAGNG